MKITMRLFAGLRQHVGHATLELDLPETATVEQAMTVLRGQYPHLPNPTLLFAINRQYVNSTTQLNHGDELAIIPPVSGG